ncbi:MAG: HTTM domain-containing protein [Proteobacteria bacterium]|nr:HTTM domain-containing protein [Pseudomonadota bacterium]
MIWRWFSDRVLFYEGSTRGAAILRILLALLLWTRWGTDVAPFVDASPARLALAASFYLSTTGMLLGVYSRISTAWAAATVLAMVFWFGPNGVEPWTHHHTAILALSTALCALTPCGHSYSWDRWRALKRGTAPVERAPLWGMRLVGLHVSTVYFWTAWDKSFWGNISGDRLEMAMHTLYLGSDASTIPGFHTAMMLASVAVIALEYFFVVGLWVRRWQWWTFPLGFAMHAAFFILLPVGTFTATMFALYIAFVDADALHDWLDRMGGDT